MNDLRIIESEGSRKIYIDSEIWRRKQQKGIEPFFDFKWQDSSIHNSYLGYTPHLATVTYSHH